MRLRGRRMRAPGAGPTPRLGMGRQPGATPRRGLRRLIVRGAAAGRQGQRRARPGGRMRISTMHRGWMAIPGISMVVGFFDGIINFIFRGQAYRRVGRGLSDLFPGKQRIYYQKQDPRAQQPWYGRYQQALKARRARMDAKQQGRVLKARTKDVGKVINFQAARGKVPGVVTKGKGRIQLKDAA